MRFTVAEEQFLIENASEHTSIELAEMLNNKFGTERTAPQVHEKCLKRLRIHTKNKTQYGFKQKEQLPIGTIRSRNNGNTYIKVDNVPYQTRASGYTKPYWMPLQEKIYTDAYGKIPNGMMVCFLNCNRKDFRLENLYPISRKIAVRMAQNKWWSADPIITMTGIRWCELFLASRKGG